MKSESDDMLDAIRKASMPLHKKIEEVGVAQKLKNKTFGKEDYVKWLLDTYRINDGLYKLCYAHYSDHNIVKSFMPSDDMLNHLVIDLLMLGQNDVQNQHSIDFEHKDHSDYSIVAVYTFLGSQMGTAIIGKYLKDNHHNWSRIYIDEMAENVHKWRQFLQAAKTFQSDLPFSFIEDYTIQMWTSIYHKIAK